MVQSLSGFLRALVSTAGALIVGMRKPPGARLPMDPSVDAAEVKHLPWFQLDRLSRVYSPHLDTLPKPPDNPIRPGGVEHIGEIIRPLPR